MRYRSEIDGLRALSIIPVLWTHLGLPFLPGGFLGVDVFFVISGFLITNILLKEIEENRFSITTFYERRARRILPALLTVILVTNILVLYIGGNPKVLADYGNSVISTLLFISNIYFWQTSGYFGSASELSPMLHTWSLAVEEQFYIFFPLLLLFINRYLKSKFLFVLIVISLISLLIAEWGARFSSIGNFYLLPTRAWELLIGSIAALLFSSNYINKLRILHAKGLTNVGILLILSSYFLFTPSTLHPTSTTLIPVLGALLVVLFSSEKGLSGAILTNRVSIKIGLISYSLYLWHQPIIALMKQTTSLHLTYQNIFIATVIITTFSYLTWRFVETPLRKNKASSNKLLLKVALISVALLLILASLFRYNLDIQKTYAPLNMERFEKMLEAENSHLNQVMFDDGKCKFWSEKLNPEFRKRFKQCSTEHGQALFVIGGSHGMDFYNALALNTSLKFVVSVSKGACRAHKQVGYAPKELNCFYDEFLDFANKYKSNISLILYTQTPDRLFRNINLDKALESDLSIPQVTEVTDYLKELKGIGDFRVTMFGTLPPIKQKPLNWDYKQPFTVTINEIYSEKALKLSRFTDRQFQQQLEGSQVQFISKIEAFSLDLPYDLVIDGKITYSDNRHLSLHGERIFGERLINYLKRKGYANITALKP